MNSFHIVTVMVNCYVFYYGKLFKISVHCFSGKFGMSNLAVTIDAGTKYMTSQILSTVAGCTVYSFTVERQAYLSLPDMKY